MTDLQKLKSFLYTDNGEVSLEQVTDIVLKRKFKKFEIERDGIDTIVQDCIFDIENP